MDRAPRDAVSTSGVPAGDDPAAVEPLGSRTTRLVAYSGPELLTTEHLLSGFDCGTAALNGWLVNKAIKNLAAGTTRTWVVVEAGTREVVAFYASSTASILRESAPKKIGRNQPDEAPGRPLGPMAVDVHHQGRGIGAALLKRFMLKALEVAQSVGVRVLLIHAKDETAKSFYSHYGFVESPLDPLVLMMLLPNV
jgi:GNAT superfamily N-acetyltransferase